MNFKCFGCYSQRHNNVNNINNTKKRIMSNIRMRTKIYIFFLLLIGVSCYKVFQGRIPNGDRVPHPCKQGKLWDGVGHKLTLGTGTRNSFGEDFENSGKTWTDDLCRKDSDGDGLTNGQELGDPDCVWRPGRVPDVTDQSKLSHPGICTPWNSPKCQSLVTNQEWVTKECESTGISCPAVNANGVIKKKITMPDSEVPARKTTYVCVDYDMPTDDSYHMVATSPIIHNKHVLHHMVLFGCDVREDDDYIRDAGHPYQCDMTPSESCQDLISVWAFGMIDDCFHGNSGVKVGRGGYRRVALQIHWNNPLNVTTYKDQSGMNMFLTKKLRKYDAAVWLVGSVYLNIPPQVTSHVTEALCAKECTKKYMSGQSLYITGVLNHMHYLGKSIKLEVIRDGVKTILAEDRQYDYDSPNPHRLSTPFEIRPGDEILTTCEYNSMSTNSTTHWGNATDDEMCFAFIWYYPKQSLRQPMCNSFKTVPKCFVEEGIPYKGCDYIEIFRGTNITWLKTAYKELFDHCDEGVCLRTCIPVIRKLKTYPCLQGDIYEFLIDQIYYGLVRRFHSLYTSCDNFLTSPNSANHSGSGLIVYVRYMLPVLILLQIIVMYVL